MGLFHDTIRDARRPLAAASVRRFAPEASEADLPEEDFSPEQPSGMQTIFRFQKAESPAMPEGLREASYRPGAAISRLPAGDPLSAGVEVESRKPSASHVDGNVGMSMQGDSRGSKLATGQEEHGSPGKVAAAKVTSESGTHQSVVLPGPIEAEWVHQRQVRTPEGGERLVSDRSETFLSRETGRGAPSEIFSSGASPRQRPAPLAGGESAPGNHSFPQESGESAWQEPAAEAGPMDSGQAPGLPPAEFAEALEPAAQGRDAPRERADPARPVAKRPHREAASWDGRGRTPEPESPSLVIGRIDVVVVSNVAQAQPQAAENGRSERAFLSRNYLKRL